MRTSKDIAYRVVTDACGTGMWSAMLLRLEELTGDAIDTRDAEWALAILEAFNMGEGYKVPLSPNVDSLRTFADKVKDSVRCPTCPRRW